MKHSVIPLGLLIVVMVACTPNAQPATPVRSSPTATQPVVTQTIKPATQSYTASVPIEFPTPNPTQDFIASICNPYPRIENNKRSPDGEWIAVSCENLNAPQEANAPFAKIVSLDGTSEWTVTFKELAGFNYTGYSDSNGWHPGMLLIHHWYKDSRFVFLVPNYSVDGINADGFGLYRFDTVTGKISPYLPITNSFYSFAFSPNDEYYIYNYAPESFLIHLVELETGKNTVFQAPKNGEYIHNILWSPDNIKIVFEGETSSQGDLTTLFLFDIHQKKFIHLLEYEQHKYIPKSWSSESHLILESYDNGIVKYDLDINTKELEIIKTP